MIARGRRSIGGFLAALTLLMMGLFCLPMSAWATEVQVDGLHVALESDQDSYDPGDIATFTLSATNQSEQTLRSANYALSFPGNMAAVGVSAVEDDLGILAPNETKTVQVKATVLSDTQAMLVRTGDGSLGSAALLLMFAVGGMAVFMMRNQKSATVTFRKVSRRSSMAISSGKPAHIKRRISKVGQTGLSILMAFGLLGFVPFAGTPKAHADEPLQSVRVSHTVNIAENEHEIAASFSFGRGGAEGWRASDAIGLPEGDLSFGSSGDDSYSGLLEVAASHDGNSHSVVYQNGVIEVKDYEVKDGLYLVDLAQYPLKEGDRVVFLPTAEYPQGAAGSLVSVVAEDGNTAVVSLEQAQSLSDVFERVNIKETSVHADFGELELADGVELVGEDYARIAATKKDELGSVKVKVPLSETTDAIIKFTPTVGLSADWTLSEGFKRFDIGFSDKMKVSIEGELFELKKNIPLLSKPLPLITDGISCIGVMPALEAKLDGKLDVKFELVSSVDIVFENGGFRTKSSTTSDLDAELEVKGSAGIAPYVTASVLGIELVDFELDAGLEAKASITERPNGMRCVDAKANVFMNVVCGKNTEWMKALQVTLSRKLITADNCPTKCKWALHSEDGNLVPECTYGKQTEGTNDDVPGSSSHGGGARGDGKDGIAPSLKDNGFGIRPEWTYDADSTYYSLVKDFNVNAGTKVTISSDEWFSFDYVTDYDRATDDAQGTLFKISWTFPGGESDSAYYGSTIGGDSPVCKGEVAIEVLYGRITIFSMRCLRELPSFAWDTCEPIDCPLHLSDSNITIGVDDEYQIECWQDVSRYQEDITDVNDLPSWSGVWSVEDTSVAWIDASGLVRGVSPGTTTIGCNYYGFQRTCAVTVK